jgi:hypothetical protein
MVGEEVGEVTGAGDSNTVSEAGDEAVEGVLSVGRKSVQGRVSVRGVAEQYRLGWSYCRQEGVLRAGARGRGVLRAGARGRGGQGAAEEEDPYAIFYPRINRKKTFQVFGATLHHTEPKAKIEKIVVIQDRQDAPTIKNPDGWTNKVDHFVFKVPLKVIMPTTTIVFPHLQSLLRTRRTARRGAWRTTRRRRTAAGGRRKRRTRRRRR